MPKLTIYLDDPDTQPIEIETPVPAIEAQDIIHNGLRYKHTIYPPHRIKKIVREDDEKR
jgi:hypothetical protein